MPRVFLAGAAVAMGALFAVAVGIGAPSPSRIIDRTLVCPISGTGYPDPARYLEVQARPRLGDNSPFAGAYNVPDLIADFKTGPDFGHGTGWMRLKGCSPGSLRIRLSSRGLRGGPSPLGARYTCQVTARVMIRLRAVFNRAVVLRREEGLLVARGRIAAGYVAVATLPGRKPIFFASVDDSTGKARLFTAPSPCRPE
jgi:hypothetical protein